MQNEVLYRMARAAFVQQASKLYTSIVRCNSTEGYEEVFMRQVRLHALYYAQHFFCLSSGT